MDMGVIRSWKVAYRQLMLRIILKDVESRIERRRHNARNIPGKNGLRKGFDSNILDACKLSVEAWETLEPAPIARCWAKARCLPRIHEAELSQQRAKETRKGNSNEVLDIVNSMQRLCVSVLNNLSESKIEEDVKEWVDFEERTYARFPIVSSLCDGDSDR